MKTLLKLLGALVLLLVLPLLAGFLLPRGYAVDRSLLIAAPVAKVFPLVADLRHWPQWGVWHRRDPQMQMTYTGVSTAVGGSVAWRSESQGNGIATWTELVPGERAVYRLEFPDMGMVGVGTITLAPEGGGVRVTYGMEGDLGGNPVFRWFGLFMDRMVGPDFEANLANLKALAEKP